MLNIARIAVATAVAVAGLSLPVAPAMAGNYCSTGGQAVIDKSYNVGSTLKGNTHRGQTITVAFTVPTSCPSQPISLATYVSATPPPFTKAEILAQTLFDSDTGTFTPGRYSLTATIPGGSGPSPTTTPLAGTTVDWTGHGSGLLPCTDGAHWVLAPAQGMTAATLTVNGVTYAMHHNGNGSWAADSGPLTSSVVASATYQGDATSPPVSLQLSHCDTFSHYQIDFSASGVLTPPWFPGISPNPLIEADAQ